MKTGLVYERNYGAHGLSVSHQAILDAVPAGSRVLDVGCASGYLALELQNKGCYVVGLEYDADAVALARKRGVDAHQVDLETELFSSSGFDVVVFGDILEHLSNPVDVLRQAHPAPRVVLSLPNIGHWTARVRHARGEWPLEDSGLFDRTHVRFYTAVSIADLINRAGFDQIEVRFTRERIPGERALGRLQQRAPTLYKLNGPIQRIQQLAADRHPRLFALQYVLTLAPHRE